MLRKGRELLAAVCKIYFYCYCTHTRTHTETHPYWSTTITTSSVRNGAGNATWPSRYPLTLAIRRADKKQQHSSNSSSNNTARKTLAAFCYISAGPGTHTHTCRHTEGERHIHRVLMEAASAVKKTEGGAGNSSCRRKRRRRGRGVSSRRRTGHACCVCGWAHYTKTLSLLQQQLWNAHSG